MDAVGGDLVAFGAGEVVHPNRSPITLTAWFPSGALEIAEQLLPLHLNRDGRFTSRERRLQGLVDVAELRVAVRMVAAFARLAVRLATVGQVFPSFSSAPRLMGTPCPGSAPPDTGGRYA